VLFRSNRDRFFAAARSRLYISLPAILYFLFLFLLPLLLVLFSLLNAKIAGFYIGLNAAFTLALRAGLPEDKGPIPTRLARVLLAGLLFWLFRLALRMAITLLPALAVASWGRFLSAGLGTFLTVWAGLKLFERLGLYRNKPKNV
jgi:hypothetical protein